ncbi:MULTISPECIES: cation diffusion facilitator family transporter [Bacillaceae]|uniref:Transporter n=1 Tax=Pseudobacillus wudalianchiensis TaxID=1743143 RepID=A0A1B9AXP9_9BACI|nr:MULTISPECIES: cation diffusion facilitator family transporter [Bacillus]KMY55757.1 transporter [Bacillus sp. FJAT-27231]OCA88755.1 transporter [Bacillus wudalianchiensis]
MDTYNDLKQGEKGAWLSIFAYIFLSVLKLAVGYVGHSKALQADGLNNTTDVIASIAILIGLKIARKPPDADHQYGHFRAETIASLIAAFIMISVGFQVLFEAGRSFFLEEDTKPDMLTAWTAVFCAVIMYAVYRYNLHLAKKIKSQSIMAAAQDNRSDALVSIGAFIGITGTQFGLSWLDTVTAFIVGLLIIKTAWDIFKDATHALTDGFDQELIGEIRATVALVSGVQQVRSVKARMHGNATLVDVTVAVDPRLNVVDSHLITEQIEDILLKKYDVQYAVVHIEPGISLQP